jgi:HSP20 family protein
MMLTKWQRPELTSWPVFGRLSDLRSEIDRLFELPFAELARTSSLLSGWMPAVDLVEDKDHFIVKAELPGMKKDDINLTLHEGCLTISGERLPEQKRGDAEVHRTERFVGRFQRTLSLPAPVAVEKIAAQYKDGVLTVTLPKTEEARPKQIDVKVG